MADGRHGVVHVHSTPPRSREDPPPRRDRRTETPARPQAAELGGSYAQGLPSRSRLETADVPIRTRPATTGSAPSTITGIPAGVSRSTRTRRPTTNTAPPIISRVAPVDRCLPSVLRGGVALMQRHFPSRVPRTHARSEERR